MIGIYTIYNRASNKYYIGSSLNVESRLKNHIASLKRGKHSNEHLQLSFNKYGEEFFEFNALDESFEFCLRSDEQYWMNLLNATNRKFGYNKDVCAYNSGKKLSEETKRKISEKTKGRVYSKEVYEKIAEKNKGQKRPNHSKKMKELYKNGFKGGLEMFDKSLAGKISGEKRKKRSSEYRLNLYKNKPIARIDKNGNIIEVFDASRRAAEKFNMDKKCILNCCNRIQKKTKGMYFKYITLNEFKNLKNKVSGEK